MKNSRDKFENTSPASNVDNIVLHLMNHIFKVPTIPEDNIVFNGDLRNWHISS